MLISKITKNTLNDFEEIGWNPIYKRNNIVIITRHKTNCSKKYYLEDLAEPFKTLGTGLWTIILGIGLVVLSPFKLIKTILNFIPTIFIIKEEKEN